MKLYIGIAGIAGMLIVILEFSYTSIIINSPNDNMWDEHKIFYNKTYNEIEDMLRKSEFFITMRKLYQDNMKNKTGQTLYSTGPNEHSDMSHDEFQGSMMGLDTNATECLEFNLMYQPPSNAQIPESVDWNKSGYVTHVVNQGKCGACYAFCAIGSLEGQHKRMTGDLVKLSEQNLIDCSYKQGNKGCAGGQMCKAFEYAADATGVNSDGDYSYVSTATDGQCKFNSNAIAAKVGGYLEIYKGDERALQMAVGLIGPVAAGIDGSLHTFRHYKSGIFSDDGCSNTSLSHAITVVGYGRENNTDYWLVKNSWGTSWGDQGFGKMLRNSNNHCGIASKALFPVVQHDSEGNPELTGHRAKP